MFETLDVSVDDCRAEIWLNRPNKLNSLSRQTLCDLIDAANWLNHQPGVKAVMISGRGRCFSAGADLDSFGGGDEESLREAADRGRLMADAIEQIQAITVARLHGWCVGGGLVLASACDIRIASDECQFAIPEVALGIPLTWGGIPRLVREIGPALTKELVISCRNFDADEALRIGFLNRRVHESALDSAVNDLITSLADKPTYPAMATKRHVNAIAGAATGISNSWSEADGLVAASLDEECLRARAEYMASLKK